MEGWKFGVKVLSRKTERNQKPTGVLLSDFSGFNRIVKAL
jgi:hypothetical protein